MHGTLPARRSQQPERRGFTLVEVVIVLAIAAVLAGVAVPSLRSQALRSARLDAVQALQRLQSEEERYRAMHGLYSADLQSLRGVGVTSPQGRYALSVEVTGPDSFHAEAQAIGEQSRDDACLRISLDVKMGYATHGPGPSCWGH
jgi:type IV pilus assembly protein PilE